MKFSRVAIAGGIAAFWGVLTLLNGWMVPRHYAPHVETEIMKASPLPLLVRASGTLEAKDSHTVKSEFEGPIESKKFREGQKVKPGELLAVLGREKIRLDYQNRKDALKNAEDDLARAKRDVRVQKQLFKQQAVAFSTVEDAQKALIKAGQSLGAAKESWLQGQKQWESSQVRSPISGTIVKDWIGEDKSVSNGKEIFTVADVSEYSVKANVDELDIKSVVEGQQAEVKLQIYDKTPLPALVKAIGSAPEGSGLPEISVVLSIVDMKNLKLRPKLTAEALIDTGHTEPVLSVPLTAVANADGNPRVWVINPWHRIHPVSVQLGRANSDRVEVTQGLGAGDRICLSAEPDYADGMTVVVTPVGQPAALSSKTHELMKEHVQKSMLDKKRKEAMKKDSPGAIRMR